MKTYIELVEIAPKIETRFKIDTQKEHFSFGKRYVIETDIQTAGKDRAVLIFESATMAVDVKEIVFGEFDLQMFGWIAWVSEGRVFSGQIAFKVLS